MKNIKSKIETLLFISAKPMSFKKIAEIVGCKEAEAKSLGLELAGDLEKRGAGVRIVKNKEKIQMASAPENSEVAREFLQTETGGELSRPSLETLTIIAYRQPISKIDLERIRGVNCSLILRNLALRDLVEAKIDKKTGESYYSLTMDFLRFLGITDVSQLPDYEKLSQADSLERILK